MDRSEGRAHKGEVTDKFISEAFGRLQARILGVVRGNRASQEGRGTVMPVNVSDERDMLMLHPLTALTEEEIGLFLEQEKIPRMTDYVDWLKEVQKACGLDVRFKSVVPEWWREKQKLLVKKRV